MAYPSTIDAPATTTVGTTLFTADDHALQHRTVGSAVIAIETAMGTTAGTNIHKNFAAGNFPARINSSGVLQQAISGTVNSSVMGTPTITGGVTSSGTFNNGVIGTSSIMGGTIINSRLGSANLQIPNADGTDGQILQTNGTGILSFVTNTAGIGGTIAYVSPTNAQVTTATSETALANGTLTIILSRTSNILAFSRSCVDHNTSGSLVFMQVSLGTTSGLEVIQAVPSAGGYYTTIATHYALNQTAGTYTAIVKAKVGGGTATFYYNDFYAIAI